MSGGHPPRTVNTFPVDTFPGSIDHALIDEPHKKTKTMEKTTEAWWYSNGATQQRGGGRSRLVRGL